MKKLQLGSAASCLLVFASCLLVFAAGATPSVDTLPAAGNRDAARAAQWNLDLDWAMKAIGLAPGMVIGEAGAGNGYFTLPAARRVGPAGRVYANDIDRRSLERLEARGQKEQLANVQTVVGAEDDPLFPRKDLDMIVLVHALHDFSKPAAWLANAAKYLRPGGTLAIIDRDPGRGAPRHFLPPARLQAFAEEAGYERVSQLEDEGDHFVLLLRPHDSARR